MFDKKQKDQRDANPLTLSTKDILKRNTAFQVSNVKISKCKNELSMANVIPAKHSA